MWCLSDLIQVNRWWNKQQNNSSYFSIVWWCGVDREFPICFWFGGRPHGEHVGPLNIGNLGEFTMLELAEVILPDKNNCDHTKKKYYKDTCFDSGYSFTGGTRNNWSKCKDRIQTQHRRWPTQEEAWYLESQGATRLGTQSLSPKGSPSDGFGFPATYIWWS